MKTRGVTCWCGKYPFPHRLWGGSCMGNPYGGRIPPSQKGETWEDYGFDEHRDLGQQLDERGSGPTIDERLDDPRRGQAREINAGR